MTTTALGERRTGCTTARRAKIVATLGPASSSEHTLVELVRAGLDVARLNFSHGTHAEKLRLIQLIRKVSREMAKPICILGDLQGPKIRTGRLKNRMPVTLKSGQKLRITPRDVVPTEEEGVQLLGSMVAYAGTYTLHEKHVVHHIDISWNQGWTGSDQVRYFELDGDTLTITTAPYRSHQDGKEGRSILVWDKVPGR